jgi:ubiquinone/menaquinone biosynthesis C-methylase UbiE
MSETPTMHTHRQAQEAFVALINDGRRVLDVACGEDPEAATRAYGALQRARSELQKELG